MGDVRDRFVDVRLIAATHQDLRQLIESKQFRSDLYFRISTVPITIPSLRERSEDIPAIVENLLQRICTEMARPLARLSAKSVHRLSAYYWPGNIRELRNVLERALLLTEKSVLEPDDFAFEPKGAQTPNSYDSHWTLDQVERYHIELALGEEQGNVEKTAKRLHIAKSTLYQKLKALKIS